MLKWKVITILSTMHRPSTFKFWNVTGIVFIEKHEVNFAWRCAFPHSAFGKMIFG